MQNKTVVDYKVFIGSGETSLTNKVSEALKEGWQPYGSVSIAEGYYVAQAMVKYGVN